MAGFLRMPIDLFTSRVLMKLKLDRALKEKSAMRNKILLLVAVGMIAGVGRLKAQSGDWSKAV